MNNRYNLSESVNRYEAGDMNQEEKIELFQYLVDTGIAWRLQGHYQRTANEMIQKGLVSKPPDSKPH